MPPRSLPGRGAGLWLLTALALILLTAAVGVTAASASNSRGGEESLTVCYRGANSLLRVADSSSECRKGESTVALTTFAGGGGDSGVTLALPTCGEGQLLVVREGIFVCGETDHLVIAPACPDGAEPRGASDYPDDMHIVLGFTVEISGDDSGSGADSAWECASGGSLNIEISDSSTGWDQFTSTTPGHKYVDEITLRGPLTSGRPATSGGSTGLVKGSHEVLENGAGKFRVEIDGAPVASANVESVAMEDLVIDVRELTTGADWDYRVYEPGDAHFGSITIRSRVGTESSELYEWWLDASLGENVRKSISVVSLKRDGSEARRYDFFECFPTRWDSGDYSPSSVAVTETIVAKCEDIEFGSADGARKAFVDWINVAVNSEASKRTVTLTETTRDGSGKTFTYLDCFPTRYVFPAFSASGTGNLYEEFEFKPERLTLN